MAKESDLVQIALFLAVGVVTAKLTRDTNRLRRLAMTDDLTGLHNLRSFEARLATMVRASREMQAPLALLVLDVDRLKSLNDQYGHLTGAEAVRTVGRVHDTAPVLSGRVFPVGTLSVSVGASCTSLDRDATSRAWSSRDVEAGEALFGAADAALY
jgi:predicted signal transduction protein with EAL and GGDEF domain